MSFFKSKAKHKAEKKKTNWRWQYRMVKNRWLFFFKPRFKVWLQDLKETQWRRT